MIFRSLFKEVLILAGCGVLISGAPFSASGAETGHNVDAGAVTPVKAEAGKLGAVQVCLAGLIREFSWFDSSGKPTRAMGSYSHSQKNIHVFKSRLGSVLCRVDRNRILLANSRGQWRTGPLDPYISFELMKGYVKINRRFADGEIVSSELSNLSLLAIIPASKTCVPLEQAASKQP